MATLYRLKYIKNGEIWLGGLAKLSLVLHELDKHLGKGIYCIVVDDRDVEYKAPIQTPKAIVTPKYPSPKPMNLNAIAAYLKKPENVEKRRLARLDDANQWAKLRNS
jgi:hypothetical protein